MVTRCRPHRQYQGALAAGFVLVAVLAASPAAAALQIVTTTTDLASITETIGGSAVSVQSLQDGTRDPHFLQAKPSHIAKARGADLWIRIGMELEIGYESVILDASRNGRIQLGAPGHLDVSGRVLRLGVPTRKVDRSMGDVHPSGNPHCWLDPLNGRIIAEEIAERLQLIDPAHEEEYVAGLSAFKRELDVAMFGESAVVGVGGDRLWELQSTGDLGDELDATGIPAGGWYAVMAPHAGKAVISHHRSWNYLIERFGLVVVAELEPLPGIPPSSKHLSYVVEIVTARGVGAILVEPYYGRKAADFVAERTGARVLMIANAAGGQPGIDTYLEMLDHAVTVLADALANQPQTGD